MEGQSQPASVHQPRPGGADLRGTGTVFIAENFGSGPRYIGHWESDEGQPTFLEQGPGWQEPNKAISWGRERAPRIVVRTGRGESLRLFSAGVIAVGPEKGREPYFEEWDSRTPPQRDV